MEIRLETLGRLRVLVGGKELTVLEQHPSRLALLVYLAVERQVRRDAVMGVFWPESDAENARHALRQALYRLRQVLGDDHWLSVTGDQLVAGETLSCDVGDLQSAVARGDHAAAAAVYHGAFLDGVHLANLQAWEQWVDAQRAGLARAHRQNCRGWVSARVAAKDLHGALDAAHAWVMPDPLDDEAQHRLIELLARAGDRTGAIRQYDAYARLLQREGLTPLEETTALYRSLVGFTAISATETPTRGGGESEHALQDSTATRASPSRAARPYRRPGAVSKLQILRGWPRRPAAVLMLAALGFVALVIAARDTRPDRSRIAVLPCEQIPPDPETAYLAIGITDQVITELSRLETITPIARSSVMRYRNAERNILRISSELDVGTILDCTIRREGSRLRVAFQLIDAGSETQIWGEPYVGDVDDVVGTENELALRIARTLKVRLSSVQTNRAPSAPSANQEAYFDYLRGREFTLATERDLQHAITYFSKATAADPGFALAHAGLADALTQLGFLSLWVPRMARDTAFAVAKRALALDDRLGEGFAALAGVKFWFDWDWVGAEQSFIQARDLHPSSVIARNNYATFLLCMRRFSESIDLLIENTRLDPLNPYAHGLLGWAYFMSADYDQAIKQSLRTIERFQDDPLSHLILAWSYAGKKLYAEAVAAADRAEPGLSGDPWLRTSLAFIRASAGNTADAERMLDELRQLEKHRYIDPWTFAVLFAVLGDPARALDELENAYNIGSPQMVFMNLATPFHAAFPRDARYTAIVQKLRFPR